MDKALILIYEKINNYLKNGGSLSDPNLPFDKDIKTYVFNKNRQKRKLMQTDPSNPICFQTFSKDEVLKSLGFEPVTKHKPLTFERVVSEIFEFVNAGGKLNYVNAKQYPFWTTFRKFQEKEAKKGIKVSFDQVLSYCGFYESEFVGVEQLLSKYADENNCIDSIRLTRDYNTIRSKATTFGCSPGEYVTLFSKYHFSKVVAPVENYIEILKKDVQEELQGGTDATGLRLKNFPLYLRVKHLREYFPEGSLNSIEETFNVLGFSYNGSLKPKTKINENYVIEKLEALFPNKVISHIDHHSTLGKNILKLSIQNNMFLYDYLKSKGFEYEAARNSNRLNQTNATYKMEILHKIVEQTAIKYNQEKMNLKFEVPVRTLKSGKKIVKPDCKVLSEGQIIYMPHTLEMDNSKKEVARLGLNEFREKYM